MKRLLNRISNILGFISVFRKRLEGTGKNVSFIINIVFISQEVDWLNHLTIMCTVHPITHMVEEGGRKAVFKAADEQHQSSADHWDQRGLIKTSFSAGPYLFSKSQHSLV